jgi:hypothetical protein
MENEPCFEKLNACLQLARWHIYVEKQNLQQPCLYKFLCLIKFKVKIEKSIHFKNGQIAKYERLWSHIEQQLS